MADISKITLPNGSSYDIKDATARTEKQNIRNGTISGAVDWNTLTTAGTYKIQKTTMTVDYNAPVGEYAYGILVVFDSDGGIEKRIMQIYFPHRIVKNYMYTRMRNADGWTEWRGLSKDADTVDGKHASDFAAASHTHTKSQITDFPTIPTKTSQLTNDSGFKTTDNNTTYSLSKSGSTITLTGSDGKTTSVTDSDTTYTLPTATSSTLGGVKIGSNITNSSGTISLTKANVTAALGYTPPTTDTTYVAATQSANGLMSAADKKKLDGIATGANAYSHPTTSGNKHIPSGGSSGQILRWSADGTAVWGADNNTDTKVTAVGNHYTPSGGSTTSASGGALTDITNSSSGVQVVTGITKDAAGHVTGITSVALKSTNTNTDTKNTTGSTDTSSKIFLVGATSQAANPQTYSHDTAYVGTDGCLYSNSTKVSVEGHTHNYAAASHTHTTQSAEATSDANASYLRQIATGTAAATTSNCPAGTLYGKY